MSPFESILGLPGLAIQRVERHKDIHIWARPAQRPACIHCQHEGVRIKATHRRTPKHTRQGNRIMVLHLRVPKYHCHSATDISATALAAFCRACAPPKPTGWKSLKRMKAV